MHSKRSGVGVLAQSPLLAAGIVVCWLTIPQKIVGILAGFGAGAMIAAISFDLLTETETGGLASWDLALGMAAGVAIFLAGDRAVERKLGDQGAHRAGVLPLTGGS